MTPIIDESFGAIPSGAPRHRAVAEEHFHTRLVHRYASRIAQHGLVLLSSVRSSKEATCFKKLVYIYSPLLFTSPVFYDLSRDSVILVFGLIGPSTINHKLCTICLWTHSDGLHVDNTPTPYHHLQNSPNNLTLANSYLLDNSHPWFGTLCH